MFQWHDRFQLFDHLICSNVENNLKIKLFSNKNEGREKQIKVLLIKQKKKEEEEKKSFEGKGRRRL